MRTGVVILLETVIDDDLSLLHFWRMQGVDLLARTTAISTGRETGAKDALK